MAMTPQIKHDFARVTAHELAHIAGARGERWMRSSVAFGRRLKTDEEKTAQKERAETALAKHRKRLKYYQKKVAAQSAPSGATAQ